MLFVIVLVKQTNTSLWRVMRNKDILLLLLTYNKWTKFKANLVLGYLSVGGMTSVNVLLDNRFLLRVETIPIPQNTILVPVPQNFRRADISFYMGVLTGDR